MATVLHVTCMSVHMQFLRRASSAGFAPVARCCLLLAGLLRLVLAARLLAVVLTMQLDTLETMHADILAPSLLAHPSRQWVPVADMHTLDRWVSPLPQFSESLELRRFVWLAQFGQTTNLTEQVHATPHTSNKWFGRTRQRRVHREHVELMAVLSCNPDLGHQGNW